MKSNVLSCSTDHKKTSIQFVQPPQKSSTSALRSKRMASFIEWLVELEIYIFRILKQLD
jgi:hypothetical protein